MKKTIFFILFLFFQIVQSQLIVTPNPFGINSGTITVTYGSLGDYSLFDPLQDPNLFLYTGLETDGTEDTWEYHDTWEDINSLVPLTWNPEVNSYVATIDIGGRNYFNEFTQTVTPIESGTTVNNWYFIIRNANGDRQSADLIGTNYGFTPSTLSNQVFEQNLNVNIVNGNALNFSLHQVQIDIYALTGQKIKSVIVLPTSEFNLQLSNRGIYFARVTANEKEKLIKFLF